MSQTHLGPRRPSPGLVQTLIVSYGDGHHDTPRGDALRIDTRPLRNPPTDPDVRERMLHATGLAPHVQAYVRATPGFERIVSAAWTTHWRSWPCPAAGSASTSTSPAAVAATELLTGLAGCRTPGRALCFQDREIAVEDLYVRLLLFLKKPLMKLSRGKLDDPMLALCLRRPCLLWIKSLTRSA